MRNLGVMSCKRRLLATRLAPWQGRKAPLPMRNDRAGIGAILLPFTPINTTQKEHKEKKKRDKRERAKKEDEEVWNRGERKRKHKKKRGERDYDS